MIKRREKTIRRPARLLITTLDFQLFKFRVLRPIPVRSEKIATAPAEPLEIATKNVNATEAPPAIARQVWF
jgi:hypothetical protein